MMVAVTDGEPEMGDCGTRVTTRSVVLVGGLEELVGSEEIGGRVVGSRKFKKRRTEWAGNKEREKY